ncbi:6-phosphofructokinase [Thalassotalea agarivorans]|uniref:6-phosphofructokinase n=1 Tax=Thalassotalea agarivorans TaxID=349064 RepID=A0A1I0F2V4_THASX|nr:ATP-dependent 6-phosphofructokinase [Thalassotalea agarivorans]SET52224.1 6-phosphofructokinase 1 [Thalassotalea agarivorans]
MTKSKRIALLTSGGDAPGMNAAIRGVVLACEKHDVQVYGYLQGYNGLIDDNYCLLTSDDVAQIVHLGGTILKSARCPQMCDDDGLKQAATNLMKSKIDALIVIGGDGSFNGLLALKRFWPGQMLGLPGTIDNDLDNTDYTIGFSTAINTALDAIDKIRDTAQAFDRVFAIELMGRHSGHLTFNTGIASGAEHIMSFENTNVSDTDKTLSELAQEINVIKQKRNRSYVIVVAENLWPGGVQTLATQLKQSHNIDCTVCVLGHIQRGGNPDAKDRVMATRMGVAAVQAVLLGETDKMVGEVNQEMVLVPLKTAIQQTKAVNSHLVEMQSTILKG